MLDHYANQASGLLGLGCQPGPRLIAMVNHGDEQAELPLLWQLCLSLVNFGYSVSVLDATTPESEANPGLQQLLDNAHWHDDGLRDTPAWTVIPSAKGIQNLCMAHGASPQSLHQLRPLLPAEGVVVLYCKAEWMTELISDWEIEPLLAVSPVQTSLLTSYMALKRLLITGKLKPTIINMLQHANPPSAASPRSTFTGLSACAKRFLGYECKTMDIWERSGDAMPCPEVQSLALRLLENSVPLGAAHASAGAIRPVGHLRHIDQFAGEH